MSRSLVHSAAHGLRRPARAARAVTAATLVVLIAAPLLAAALGVVAPAPAAASSGAFTPAPSASALPEPQSTYPPGSGAGVFAENCSGCHGRDGEGLVGPPLASAGFASIVAGIVERGGTNMPPFGGVLGDGDISAVAAYVAGELSDPSAREAQVAAGGETYRLYCSGCHSATGRGGALTRGRNAPNIAVKPAAVALAAMILGPGNMPAFAGNTLDVRQQAAVGRYVEVLTQPPSPGGRGLGYLGPVTEGAVSAIALLLLIAIAVWLSWPSRKAVP